MGVWKWVLGFPLADTWNNVPLLFHPALRRGGSARSSRNDEISCDDFLQLHARMCGEEEEGWLENGFGQIFLFVQFQTWRKHCDSEFSTSFYMIDSFSRSAGNHLTSSLLMHLKFKWINTQPFRCNYTNCHRFILEVALVFLLWAEDISSKHQENHTLPILISFLTFSYLLDYYSSE